MKIKSIVAGAAIALAATIGSASAAETFVTLHGVPVEALGSDESLGVRGARVRIRVFDTSFSGDLIAELDKTNLPGPIDIIVFTGQGLFQRLTPEPCCPPF